MPPKKPYTERKITPTIVPIVLERTALRFRMQELEAGTQMVQLGSQSALRADPHNGRTALGIYGLDGNFAVMVILEKPGYALSRVMILGHYSPRSLLIPMQSLIKLLRQYLAKGMQATALLVEPGHWVNVDCDPADVRDETDDDYELPAPELSPQYPDLHQAWTTALQEVLPDLPGLSRRYYHLAPHPCVADHGCVLVEFPQGGNFRRHVLVEGQEA